jgi:hypothetical protein
MWFSFYMTGLLACLIGAVFFSVHGRRPGIHPLESRMIKGKLNMVLGTLMLLFGINQFTFDPISTVRLVVAFVFLAMGGINLIFGFRNYATNRKLWKAEQNKPGTEKE